MLRNILWSATKQLKQYSRPYCITQINGRCQYISTGLTDADINDTIKKFENYKGKVYPSHTFIKIDVRWGDQDAMNHVNNIKYFQFLEQARVSWFFHSANLPLSAVEAEINNVKTLPILARTEVSYKRPVTYPDTLLIGFSSEATNKSRGDFKHTYIIYSTAQKQVVSTGEADLVTYDYKDKKRQPVPDDWVF